MHGVKVSAAFVRSKFLLLFLLNCALDETRENCSRSRAYSRSQLNYIGRDILKFIINNKQFKCGRQLSERREA